MRNATATATARKSPARAKSADAPIVVEAHPGAPPPADESPMAPLARRWRALQADLPAAKIAAKLVEAERDARKSLALAIGHGSTVTVDGVTYCAAIKSTSRVDHAAQWAAALDAAPPAFRAVMESIAASGRYVSPSVNAEIVTLGGGTPTGN